MTGRALALVFPLAAGLVATSLATAKPPAAATSVCRPGSVPAVIGGKIVCLTGGQKCLAKYEQTYRKKGFHCAVGHLRKVMAPKPPPPTATTPTTTPTPPPPQLFTYGFSGLTFSWTFTADPNNPTPEAVTFSGSSCGTTVFEQPWHISWQVSDGSREEGFVNFAVANPADVFIGTQTVTQVQTGQVQTSQVNVFLALAQDGSSVTVTGQPTGAVTNLAGATETIQKTPATACG